MAVSASPNPIEPLQKLVRLRLEGRPPRSPRSPRAVLCWKPRFPRRGFPFGGAELTDQARLEGTL